MLLECENADIALLRKIYIPEHFYIRLGMDIKM